MREEAELSREILQISVWIWHPSKQWAGVGGGGRDGTWAVAGRAADRDADLMTHWSIQPGAPEQRLPFRDVP